MFNSSSAKVISAPITVHKIGHPSDLANHFQGCRDKQFSGRLDLSSFEAPKLRWSFFFYLGRLFWSTGEFHPFRRWNRQLLQYCPHLTLRSLPPNLIRSTPLWDYEVLVDRVKQGQIQPSTLSAIVAGQSLEILFDVIQTGNESQSPSSLYLTYRPLPTTLTNSTLLAAFDVERGWHRAEQAWFLWQQWELGSISPNLAPIVWDDAALRKQTSLLTYHNLTTLANGFWTLRDLAVKLKQPLVPLTRSLMPYVKQGIMGLSAVGDIQLCEQPVRPLCIAYIEDSRFDSMAMSQILDHAGHQFVSISNPLQAVPTLLEKKPDLIFLDLLMPIANGYEVCTQLRRITAFKEIPIIILTSSDGIVDRVRAKLVGASGFLAKPIEPNKVLDTLQRYVPSLASPAPRGTNPENTS
jgi:CheY-like chemotaxis protein